MNEPHCHVRDHCPSCH